MAHKYYCTYCARELTQETVLLDMEPALKGTKENKFHSLKFLVTKAEFEEMLEQSRGQETDMGFVRVKLPFVKFAEFLGNDNNLKKAEIQNLTLEDVNHFIKEWDKAEYGDGNAQKSNINQVFIVGATMDAQAPEEEKEKKPQWSPTIETMLRQNTTSKDPRKVQRDLYEDLKELKKHFDEDGIAEMIVMPSYEKADDGTDVLMKYQAKHGDTTFEVQEARTCCHCGTKVFKYAGLAEHRSVAFIGEQSSGKTSTILAMISYALNAVSGAGKKDVIWKPTQEFEGDQKIQGIKFVELLQPTIELENDMTLYAHGYAPAKTKAQSRKNAYSATLWIQNDNRQSFILTLMDLPGELCRDNGEIDADNILSKFPVALACDAFIVCFDSLKADDNRKNTIICSWAHEFQALRRTYKTKSAVDNDEGPNKIDEDCLAPMMVLFNKCEGLEHARKDKVHVDPKKDPCFDSDRTRDVYGLKQERDFIDDSSDEADNANVGDDGEKEHKDNNEVYRRVGELLGDYKNLNKAYFARLRCSPYGFEAVRYGQSTKQNEEEQQFEDHEDGSESDYQIENEQAMPYVNNVVEDGNEPVKKIEIDPADPGNKEDGKIRYPRPIHIRELMHWLFTVSGYIPADAEYCPNPSDREHVYKPGDAYVTRAQYRVKNPWGRTSKEGLNEALCRAYLFEKCSEADQVVLKHYEEILKGRTLEDIYKEYGLLPDDGKTDSEPSTNLLDGVLKWGQKMINVLLGKG